MNAPSRLSRRQGVAAGVVVIALGLSVRFPITSVSPLLADIGEHYHLSHTGLAALSAIPVLLFGLASPLAPWLVSRLGLERTLVVLLAALTGATALRPLSTPTLFLGTVIIGAAIALVGIVTPQVIRQSFPKRGGFWTGVYTTSFGISAASGAALAVPVYSMLGENVAYALASWTVPLLIAFALVLSLAPRGRAGADVGVGSSPVVSPTASGADQPRESIFRAKGLWPVTGFFACQALIYFSLTAWLPTIAAARGIDPTQAGLLLAWLSVAGLPASLLAPTIASKASFRTALVVIIASLSATGLVGLAVAPISLAPLMIAILGIAQSAAFGLSIALIVFTAPSAAATASFSAVSQGIGYLIAAIGPLGLGLLADTGITWTAILLMLVAASVGKLIFGVLSTRASRQVAQA
ncbi:MFS transporter [Leucobacter sp. cx-42]|uniref:MFS transporter n=1 Tax=unclassified Leucobacter TaxID=2621730 RepID=UPI00165D83B5|nr:MULTISPECIES: MFS transporter [unclassified Leucobacter]MBC9954121.1 MFS transporter [Leucobacter sp. cx-42]